MEITRYVIEVLVSNGYLLLSSALNMASMCKTLQGALSGVYWERALQRHFPSFYLTHLDKYNKRKDVSWKEEYKKAYQSMGLRYMNGANLQQSKVVHFGPTLDEYTIDAINNHDDGFHLPEYVWGVWDAGICYEGNFLHGSKADGSLLVTDVATAIAKKNLEYSFRNGTIFAGRLYVTKWTEHEEQYHHWLMCYDVKSRRKIWQQDVNRDSTKAAKQTKGSHVEARKEFRENYPIVPFDDKVFLLGNLHLMCFDGVAGEELFRIKSVTTVKTLYRRINPRKKRRTEAEDNKERDNCHEEDIKCGEQLAIEGDFAVWTVQGSIQKLVVVANWRKQQIHGTFDLNTSEIPEFEISRFAVSDGMFYVNTYDMHSDSVKSVALDMNFASEQSEVTQVWEYEGPAPCELAIVGPCIYGDIVFNMLCSNGSDSWVFALDASSGQAIWRWRLDIGKSRSGARMTAVDLFVIEGTASIAERQNLRQKRLKETAEREPSTDVTEENEEDSDAEYAQITEKGDDTKFPTLRFTIHNNFVDSLFEGAAIAETGELLYFKETEDTKYPCNNVVAISKHQKPQYFCMSA